MFESSEKIEWESKLPNQDDSLTETVALALAPQIKIP
jgi:hypothetical protein